MTEEAWENNSDKEEVVEGDNENDFLFGEETGGLRRASILKGKRSCG